MTNAADPAVVVVTARPDPGGLTRLFALAYPTLALAEAGAARIFSDFSDLAAVIAAA